MDGKYSHFAECSKEELRAIGHKGGTNSGKARRERASAREAADMLLSLPLSNAEMLNRLEEVGIPEGEKINNMLATITALMLKGWSGDANAIKILLELVGEGPTQNINANITNNSEELKGILEQLGE